MTPAFAGAGSQRGLSSNIYPVSEAWLQERHGPLFVNVRREGVRLDMTRAQFPAGETTIRLNGFVYDVAVTVPAEVGVSLISNGFVVDSRLGAQQASRFLTGAQLNTPNYMTAERRLRIVNACFVGNVRVGL